MKNCRIISVLLALVVVVTSFGFGTAEVFAASSQVTTKTVKVGKYTVKFKANGGVIGGASKIKSKSGKFTYMPVAFKNGYTTTGWYSGSKKYTKNTKITKNVTLTAKYGGKISSKKYYSLVDSEYLSDTYPDVWDDTLVGIAIDDKSADTIYDSKDVAKYYINKLLPKGYCPNRYFNPTAYRSIVSSKYGIKLNSNKEAINFYIAIGEKKNESATKKCIHQGGKFNDERTIKESHYYPDKYRVEEVNGGSMACSCGYHFNSVVSGRTDDEFYLHRDEADWSDYGHESGGYAPYSNQNWVFYKKTDHEHFDVYKSSYCTNQGKRVSKKYSERKYTPYRTDVPKQTYPYKSLVWIVDKF